MSTRLSRRAVIGVVVLLATLAYVAVGAARRSDLVPGPDPFLAAALVAIGAWLLGTSWARRQQATVSAAALARHPDPAIHLDAAELHGSPQPHPAWDAPPVRAAWSRHRRTVTRPLAGAVVAAVALALPLHTYRQGDADLAAAGVRADGQVLWSGWSYEGRGGRSSERVAYSFNGRPMTADIAGPAPAAAPEGSHLRLRVEAEHPDHVRAEGTPGTTSALEWWITAMGVAAIGLLVVAACRLVRLLRWRRLLRAQPLLDARVTVRDIVGLVRTSTDEALVHGIGLPDDADVGILAPPGRVVLVAMPGSIREVRLPRTAAEGRRWRRRHG